MVFLSGLLLLCVVVHSQNTTSPTTLAPTTIAPTTEPTATPTTPVPTTAAPTLAPTLAPTVAPTVEPTVAPTKTPTAAPTAAPTRAPTMAPSAPPAAKFLQIYGGPAPDSILALSTNLTLPTPESYKATIQNVSLNLWPYFRVSPICADYRATCKVSFFHNNGTIIDGTNITLSLRNVQNTWMNVTSGNTTQIFPITSVRGNRTIVVRGSHLNEPKSFVNYFVFDADFVRVDQWPGQTASSICTAWAMNASICAQNVTCEGQSEIVRFSANNSGGCNNSPASLAPFQRVSLPYIVDFMVPRYFTIEYKMFSGTFAPSGASVPAVALNPVFSVDDLRSEDYYVWEGSPPSVDSFFVNSPFKLNVTSIEEPNKITFSSSVSGESCVLVTNADVQDCVLPAQFSIVLSCTGPAPCSATIRTGSTATPIYYELYGNGAHVDLTADRLADLPTTNGQVDFFVYTATEAYNVTVTVPYISTILMYGSYDDVPSSAQALSLSSNDVKIDFHNNVTRYDFSARKAYKFAVNCSRPTNVSISLLQGTFPCGPGALDSPTFTTLTTPVVSSVITVKEQYSSSLLYYFSPYVQSINNIVFRGSQSAKGPWSIIEFSFDPKVRQYNLAVPQWFTFTATITPCPQVAGSQTPCTFNYDTSNNGSLVGNGGQETAPLRMDILAELGLNTTGGYYPPMPLTIGLLNATTTFSLTLSTSCSANYFYPSIAGPVVCADPAFADSACCPCPDFAECKANSTRPIALPGYQQSVGSIWVMVRCEPLVACVGDGRCAPGYTDVACSRCDRNANPPRYRVNFECEECPDDAGVVVFIGIVIFFIILMLFLKISKPDYTKKYTLSITLAFAQIVSIFASFPVAWPVPTLFMFNLFSFLNFNIELFAPDCAIKLDFFSKWVIKMMIPVAVVVTFAIIYFFVKCFPRCRRVYIDFMIWDLEDKFSARVDRKRMAAEQKEMEGFVGVAEFESTKLSRRETERQWEETHLKERFIHALVAGAVVVYTFLAKTASEPLNCVAQVGGVSHVREDPAAYCSGDWYIYAGLSWLAVAVYTAGIPLFFGFVLIRAWYTKTLDDPKFYYKFGHLVLPYRGIYWYWELVQMSRKLITILLIDFFSTAPGEATKTQINSVMLVLVFFLALQEFVKPYEFSWCNRVAFTWNTFTLIVLMSALLFSFPELSTSLAVVYGLAVLAGAGFTVFVSCYAFLQELRRTRARRMLFFGTNQLDKEKEEQAVLTSMFGSNLAKALHRKTRDLPPSQRNFMYHRLGLWRDSSQGMELGVVQTN